MQDSEPFIHDFDTLPIPNLPIMLSSHTQTIAEQIANESPPARQRDVYLNALTVFSVRYYLHYLGLETSLKSTRFSNQFYRNLTNVRDIIVPNIGTIECCLANNSRVSISAMSWNDRVAYIAVNIDVDCDQAILLGFLGNLNLLNIQSINSEELDLKIFRDMDDFPDYINEIYSKEYISNWLKGLYLGTYQPAFRNINSASGIKTIEIDSYTFDLILTVSIYSSEEFQIYIRVRSEEGLSNLPIGLEVTVLDDDENEILSPIKATQNSNLIDLTLREKILCEVGDQFCIRLCLNKITVTERLVV